ncbi:MAG TPA: SPOR domain-containing protein [Melioribacteraceae bacterium]|nr:SPOR domain-containing protein [Melioribacteraceae bacterium]
MRLPYYLVFLLFSVSVLAQEADITSALRQIESGNIKGAEASLKEIKRSSPGDPSVIFLDAVLTVNGEEALKKYSSVYEKFPKSKYADASLYRIFSYYYSLGYYKKAESYLSKLKSDYPDSPYLKSADRNIPDSEEVIEITKTEESLPVKYNYTIQAGAFLNVDNAKRLEEQIKSDGYPAEITTKEIGGSILNVVTVGKLAKEEEALPLLEYLSKKYNLTGRVISSTE